MISRELRACKNQVCCRSVFSTHSIKFTCVGLFVPIPIRHLHPTIHPQIQTLIQSIESKERSIETTSHIDPARIDRNNASIAFFPFPSRSDDEGPHVMSRGNSTWYRQALRGSTSLTKFNPFRSVMMVINVQDRSPIQTLVLSGKRKESDLYCPRDARERTIRID